MSITFRQISKRRRKKTHGFRKRMSTPGGKRIIKRRKAKGRRRLTVEWFFVIYVSKESVIKKSSEIRTILQTGKHVSNPLFKIAYRPSVNKRSRWAVLIGKRYGKAVERNRIKRQLREILRGIVPRLQSDLDLLVIPKRVETGTSFSVLKEKVHHCFQREGLLWICSFKRKF